MNPNAIFYPDFAMVVLTAVVYLVNLTFRLQAVKAKKIPASHLKTFQGGTPTEAMLQAKNNIANLFETPIFFYLITVILFVTNQVDAFAVTIAWLYVACRVLHSLVHLTCNHVTTRFTFFLLSIVGLLLLWGRWLAGVV